MDRIVKIALITKVVKRGFEKVNEMCEDVVYRTKIDMFLDLTHTHDNCPLDFEKLLKFDDFSFYHDILGIADNLDRTTHELNNCFLPRCAK